MNSNTSNLIARILTSKTGLELPVTFNEALFWFNVAKSQFTSIKRKEELKPFELGMIIELMEIQIISNKIKSKSL